MPNKSTPPRKLAVSPVTFRGYTMAQRQLIPIARALGWPEPDPLDNKSIVAFLRRLIDHTYVREVEELPLADQERDRMIAAIRLVAAYAEGLPETPAALKPALALAEKFSSV